MKKIAIIIPALRNVGPVRVAYDIIEQLQEKHDANQVKFEVFYLDEKGDIKFPCKQTRLTIFNFWELYKFGVIHSHMIRPDLINSLIFCFKGKKISTIHNIVETDLFYSHGKVIAAVFSRIWKFIWKNIDLKVVLTNTAKNYYISRLNIPSCDIRIINNGVESLQKPEQFEPDILDAVNRFKSKGLKILGTVSLFNKRKGIEQIIQMLSIDLNLACVIIGDGPILNELKDLSVKLHVEDRVFFSGFRNNGKKHVFLFDCYIMPSREEGFPLALTEALSSGVVTVCSNIPVFNEILDENTTTFFELDDLYSLKNAVHHSIAHSTRLSYEAKTKFNSFYTREIMAEKYFQLYVA